MPQKPDSMPSDPTTAGSPPNLPTSTGRPTPAAITGKAAKALPVATVSAAMPSV